MYTTVWSRRGLARASMGANVGSYHGVLTASSEHGMQNRQARLAADLVPKKSVPLRSGTRESPLDLHRWEDDGGGMRQRDAAKTPASARATLRLALRR